MARGFYRETVLGTVFVVTCVLAGCAGPKGVIITYEPLVNTSKLGTGSSAGTKMRFAVYCLSKIQNTGAEADNFDFEIADLRIADAKPTESFFSSQVWPWSVLDTSVPAGATQYNLGVIALRIDVEEQPTPDYHTVHLKYLGTGDQNVSMVPYPNPPSPSYLAFVGPNNLPACTDGHTIPE